MWIKSLDNYTAQVRKRTLFGHLVYSEEILEEIVESNNFHILESENVAKIGALCKVSKFVLIFDSKTAKEKLENMEILTRFDDFELALTLIRPQK